MTSALLSPAGENGPFERHAHTNMLEGVMALPADERSADPLIAA